tara:strand:- start:8951 stop:9310 length:360 start_codon:yes stop_codon:yes gene_type:complete
MLDLITIGAPIVYILYCITLVIPFFHLLWQCAVAFIKTPKNGDKRWTDMVEVEKNFVTHIHRFLNKKSDSTDGDKEMKTFVFCLVFPALQAYFWPLTILIIIVYVILYFIRENYHNKEE